MLKKLYHPTEGMIKPSGPITKHMTALVVVIFATVVFGATALLSSQVGNKIFGFNLRTLTSYAADSGATDFTVLTPSASDKFTNGSSMKITWTVPNINTLVPVKLNIKLINSPACLDTVPPCQTFAPPATYNIGQQDLTAGSYAWVIPDSVAQSFAGEVRILLESTDFSFSAMSQKFYLVYSAPVPSAFKIYTPAFGDKWQAGSTHTISWQQTGFIQTRPLIELIPVTSSNFAPTNPQPFIITDRAYNTGSYGWTIPGTLNSAFYNSPVAVRITVNGQSVTSGTFYITPETSSSLDISTTSMVNGTAGVQYSFQFQARGGTVPYSWQLTSAPGAGNISMSSEGVLSGIPNLGIHRVTVTVNDSAGKSLSRTFLWQVTSRPITDVPHSDGTLVLGLFNTPSSVSLIENRLLRPFPTAEVFISHGYKWNRIVAANDADGTLFVGEGFRFAPGTLVVDNSSSEDRGIVYLIYPNNVKRGFTSVQAFYDMGYKFSQVVAGNLTGYITGTPINGIEAHPVGSDILVRGTNLAAPTTVYRITSEKARSPYQSVGIYNTWHTYDNDFSKVVPANSFDISLPEVGAMPPRYEIKP